MANLADFEKHLDVPEGSVLGAVPLRDGSHRVTLAHGRVMEVTLPGPPRADEPAAQDEEPGPVEEAPETAGEDDQAELALDEPKDEGEPEPDSSADEESPEEPDDE